MLSDFDRGDQRRLEASRARRCLAPEARERVGHGISAVLFVAAATVLALHAPAERALSLPIAAILVLLYAVASSIEFENATGYTVPAQLVFVPMLLLLPTPLVPLLVALGLVLSAALQAAVGRQPQERVLLAVPDAAFALAPSFVLVVFDAQTPAWQDFPFYVLALAAQFTGDLVFSTARMWMALGLRPSQLAHELGFAYVVDATLAPVGLLAAFSADELHAAAPLLLAPLLGLFVMLSRERGTRIGSVLELSRAYQGSARLLHDLLERADEYTGRHANDVVELTLAVCNRLAVDEQTRSDAELGALLHDVGKISVPREILHKPGPLTDAEWAVMRTHTVVGHEMLAQIGGPLERVGRVVRASHERWDGHGYPDGLARQEIPLAARIVSACDTFDAIVSDRPYRPARPPFAARQELQACAGTQLDPDVVSALLARLDEGGSSTSLSSIRQRAH